MKKTLRSLSDFLINSNAFENSKLCYHILCIRTTTFNISLILLIYLVSIIVRKTGDLKGYVGLSIILLFSTLLNMMASKKIMKTHLPKIFTVYLIAILVLAYELTLKYFQNNSKKEAFMGGFISTYIVCLAFLSRLHWLLISVVLLTQSILICCLVNVDEANSETSITLEIPIIAFVVFAFFTNISFKLEKSEREQFAVKEKNKNTLESLKRLIDCSLPDQIFIIPKDCHLMRKPFFKNEAALAASRSAGFLDIISYLESVKLQSFHGKVDRKNVMFSPNVIEYLLSQGTNKSYFKSFLCKLPLFLNQRRESRSSLSSPRDEAHLRFNSQIFSPNAISIKVKSISCFL